MSLIFDVKRYAINDGPGIRVTIFLKGCPLSCVWCHNPESIEKTVEKLFTSSKCIGCNACVESCENHACTLTDQGILTDTNVCLLCEKCAEVCPTGATQMSGTQYQVDEIMDIIKKEITVMDQSEGGVTFSGGEPLFHHELLIQLLDACGKEEIHRCIDTTGFTTPQKLLEVASLCEHFLYDLKVMDDAKHKQYTGVSNAQILSNLQLLATTNVNINIRIPLISGVNDDDENIHQTAQFIKSLKKALVMVNILPYHNIAQKKYEKLGKISHFIKMEEPDKMRQKKIIELFNSYGIDAVIGG
ncbi:MAG: glycyl-radical enzyme activating protein [Sulfurospirillaceae bacterium]|nr:glycyl-radical enzyme activating protein [Sulfurospirillaceae bacterium]